MEVEEALIGKPLQELWTAQQVSAFLHVPVGCCPSLILQRTASLGLPTRVRGLVGMVTALSAR